jgi:hypothetical protein
MIADPNSNEISTLIGHLGKKSEVLGVWLNTKPLYTLSYEDLASKAEVGFQGWVRLGSRW